MFCGLLSLQSLCGLPVNTYFSAVKLRWLIDNSETVRKAVNEGRCMFGTVDSWLLWVTIGKSTVLGSQVQPCSLHLSWTLLSSWCYSRLYCITDNCTNYTHGSFMWRHLGWQCFCMFLEHDRGSQWWDSCHRHHQCFTHNVSKPAYPDLGSLFMQVSMKHCADQNVAVDDDWDGDDDVDDDGDDHDDVMIMMIMIFFMMMMSCYDGEKWWWWWRRWW